MAGRRQAEQPALTSPLPHTPFLTLEWFAIRKCYLGSSDGPQRARGHIPQSHAPSPKEGVVIGGEETEERAGGREHRSGRAREGESKVVGGGCSKHRGLLPME